MGSINLSALVRHLSDSVKHITAAERTAWNAKANKSDIPTSLPANGGNAATVGGYAPTTAGTKGIPVVTSDFGTMEIGQYIDFHNAAGQDYLTRILSQRAGEVHIVGASNYGNTVIADVFTDNTGKIKLWVDNEGGNLQLKSPNGTKYVQMDVYDNNTFRMYFDGGNGLDFPFLYNFGTKTLTVTGALDGFIKSKHTIGTSSECTYKTIESWAAAQPGVSWAFVISSYGYPSDAPVQAEGLLRVETDSSASRKIVTFIPYNTSTDEYRRDMFNGGWRAGWQSRQTGSGGYVTGGLSVTSSTHTITLGFQPSAILCVGSMINGEAGVPDMQNSIIVDSAETGTLVCGCTTGSGSSSYNSSADVIIKRTSTGFTAQAQKASLRTPPVVKYIAYK